MTKCIYLKTTLKRSYSIWQIICINCIQIIQIIYSLHKFLNVAKKVWPDLGNFHSDLYINIQFGHIHPGTNLNTKNNPLHTPALWIISKYIHIFFSEPSQQP